MDRDTLKYGSYWFFLIRGLRQGLREWKEKKRKEDHLFRPTIVLSDDGLALGHSNLQCDQKQVLAQFISSGKTVGKVQVCRWPKTPQSYCCEFSLNLHWWRLNAIQKVNLIAKFLAVSIILIQCTERHLCPPEIRKYCQTATFHYSYQQGLEIQMSCDSKFCADEINNCTLS